MTYTKQSVIERAQQLGSSAKTVKGACAYLRTQLRKIKPLGYGAHRANHMFRGMKDLADYRYIRRGERICAALRLPMDYEARLSALRSAQAEAESHHAPTISLRLIGRLLTRYRWSPEKIRQAALDSVGLAIDMCAELDALAKSAAASLRDNWPMKKSTSSWAGGDHSVAVRWILDGQVGCGGGSDRVWSDNGKWSGTDSYAELTVSAAALRRYSDLRTPDGLIVLHYEPIPEHPRCAKIVWVEQGRGFALKAVHGYLVRGYHVQARSVEAAVKKVTVIRQTACAKAIAAKLQQRQDRRDYGLIWVGVQDSLAGGNCATGTENYRQQLCRIVGGEIGGVRADWLLRQRRDTYTLRAVRAALVRSGHPVAQGVA